MSNESAIHPIVIGYKKRMQTTQLLPKASPKRCCILNNILYYIRAARHQCCSMQMVLMYPGPYLIMIC